MEESDMIHPTEAAMVVADEPTLCEIHNVVEEVFGSFAQHDGHWERTPGEMRLCKMVAALRRDIARLEATSNV